jgi:hypothetical protein
MACQPLTCIPAQSEVGDTVQFSQNLGCVVDPDYTVRLYLAIGGVPATNVAGTANNSSWDFTLSSAVTTNLSHGRYDYVFKATKTADNTVSTPKTGQIVFIPNLAATTAPSTAQVLLTALNETILLINANPDQSYSFNGQSVTKRDLAQLMDMRRELQAEVFREQRAAANRRGVIDDGNIGVRFTGGYGGPGYGWPYGPGCGC